MQFPLLVRGSIHCAVFVTGTWVDTLCSFRYWYVGRYIVQFSLLVRGSIHCAVFITCILVWCFVQLLCTHLVDKRR